MQPLIVKQLICRANRGILLKQFLTRNISTTKMVQIKVILIELLLLHNNLYAILHIFPCSRVNCF